MKLSTVRQLSKTDLKLIHEFSYGINHLQLGNTPIVLELSKFEIQVGKYLVTRVTEGKWIATNTLSSSVTEFCNKKNAMYYALFMIKHKVKQAVELQSYDSKLAVLTSEIDILKYNLKVSTENNDTWNTNLSEARLAEATNNFRSTRTQIKKWFSQAKYNKIQELQL